MRILTIAAAAILACLGVLSAQQGHPLTGTWNGDWGASPTQRNQVTIVMNWDGKNVTGVLNPGPDSAKLTGVYVDPSKWLVRIEADVKGKHVTAEGHIDDLGSYHRTLSGTWTEGSTKGDFKLTRD